MRMVHDGECAYEFSAWSLHSIALHSPPALLPVSVLAELKPGSCLYLSRSMGAATGELGSCLPKADALLCNPNEFDLEGTPPWL
ncbi:hypothetical protein ALP51_103019 [Pseudomonas savastanoi]|uniref:Uncharacterized protein n=1 Tax=Pseudomonas savastanoi TaxID=29438 RepID=A0A3M5J595_PSESS|nr:hypothetical protein ALP51_103019 [Pseudomonas savastanoi]